MSSSVGFDVGAVYVNGGPFHDFPCSVSSTDTNNKCTLNLCGISTIICRNTLLGDVYIDDSFSLFSRATYWLAKVS